MHKWILSILGLTGNKVHFEKYVMRLMTIFSVVKLTFGHMFVALFVQDSYASQNLWVYFVVVAGPRLLRS